MQKEQMLDKAKEQLSPFETGHIVDFIQHLTLKSAMENPIIIIFFLIIAFYAIIRRSKFVLVFILGAIMIMLLIRYTLSPEQVGGELSVSTTLPFVGGGLAIGAVLIYLTFIKHE